MMNWLGDWFDNCINLRRFLHGLNPLSLMERGVTSTSGRPQQGGWKNTRVKRLRPDRPVGVLSKWEFQARFHIPDIIPIQLTDDKALSSVDISNNMICFTKKQFVEVLRFPLPSIFKQFLPFTQSTLIFLYSNIIRILMECSVLDMLFQLDLSLLEVLFIYIVKMSQKERLSLFAHIPFLQLVTNFLESSKGQSKAHVLVFNPWSGLSEGQDGVFSSRRSLGILSRLYFYHFHSVLLLFPHCC